MDYLDFYDRHALEYDELVAAEDVEGNLPRAIESIAPGADLSVLDVGAGTGRIAKLLLRRASRVIALDRAPAMLAVARERLAGSTARLVRADARALPVRPGRADLAIAGWVFGHFRTWMPAGWREEVSASLAEMDLALRPGGPLVLVETLGTGSAEPRPPTPGLAEYFDWLERDQGFRKMAIRTDYRFPDAETAARVTGAFFGPEFAATVRRERWARVPECTGLWFRPAQARGGH